MSICLSRFSFYFSLFYFDSFLLFFDIFFIFFFYLFLSFFRSSSLSHRKLTRVGQTILMLFDNGYALCLVFVKFYLFLFVVVVITSAILFICSCRRKSNNFVSMGLVRSNWTNELFFSNFFKEKKSIFATEEMKTKIINIDERESLDKMKWWTFTS